MGRSRRGPSWSGSSPPAQAIGKEAPGASTRSAHPTPVLEPPPPRGGRRARWDEPALAPDADAAGLARHSVGRASRGARQPRTPHPAPVPSSLWHSHPGRRLGADPCPWPLSGRLCSCRASTAVSSRGLGLCPTNGECSAGRSCVGTVTAWGVSWGRRPRPERGSCGLWTQQGTTATLRGCPRTCAHGGDPREAFPAASSYGLPDLCPRHPQGHPQLPGQRPARTFQGGQGRGHHTRTQARRECHTVFPSQIFAVP